MLGFLQTGIANVDTEATDRTVKISAHTTHGIRILDNQRRRVRSACSRCGHRVTAC